VLPAGLAAAGAAVATLKIGFSGFGDVMKAVAEGDAEKFQESLKKLTPAARAVAQALWDLRPAFQSIRDTVQERLFAGLGVEVRDLAGRYLPMLERMLGRIATSMNKAAREVAAFLKTSAATDAARRIFDRIGDAFERLVPAARNVAGALLDITDVGSEFLAPIADEVTDLTRRFRDFVAQAKETGQLRTWISTGIDAVKRLGSTVGNVGSTIMGVFRAADSTGRNFLVTLDEGTEKLAAWVNSARGQTALADFFRAASDAAANLLPILTAAAEVIGTKLAPLLARISEHIGPGVEAVVRGLGDAIERAGPQIEEFFAAVGDLLVALGDAGPLVGALAGGVAEVLTPAVKALTWALEALTGWFNALPQPMQDTIGLLGGWVIAGGLLTLALGKIVRVGAGVAETFGLIKKAAQGVGLLKMPALDAADATTKGRAAGTAARGGFLKALGEGLATAAGAVFSGSFWARAGSLLSKVGPKLLNLGKFLGPWGLATTTAIGLAWELWNNWDTVSQWITDAAGAVGDFFAGWGPTIGQAVSSVGTWFSELPGKIGSGLSSAASSVATWASDLASSIATGLADAGAAVLAWLAELPGKIAEFLAGLPQMLWDLLVNALSYAAEGAGYGIGLILALVVGISMLIVTALSTLGQLLWDWAVAAWEWCKQAFIAGTNAVFEWATGLPGRVLTGLEAFGQMLADWATAAWEWCRNAVVTGVNAAYDWMVALPGRVMAGLASFGTQLDRWARDAWTWAKNTTQATIDSIVDFVRNFPRRALDAIGSLGSSLDRWARDAWTWARNAFVNGANSVIDWVRSLPGKIVDAIGNVGSLLYDAGEKIIGGFLRGLRNAVGDVFSFVGSIAGRIQDLKGPITVDRVLLVEQGRAIMSGLDRGLREEFGTVRQTLQQMTSDLPAMTVPIRTAGANALLSAAAGTPPVPARAGELAPISIPVLRGGGGSAVSVSVTQNIYNPAPETPSESLTRRMRRISELGLREALDRRQT